MSTLTHDQQPDLTTRPPRALRWALWLIPLHGLLLLWGTWERQPSPSTELAEWSRFVTTDDFFWAHLAASIGGQTAALLATASLSIILLSRGAPAGRTVTGMLLHLTGSGLLLAGFGVAAFTQPAIGELHTEHPGLAERMYDAVYSPVAIVTLLVGAALFGLSTLWTGSALAALDEVPTVAGRLYGAAGPTFAVVGFLVGPVQTLGALLFLVSGVMVAKALAGPRA